MLLELNIKNFAIIDNLNIRFSKGLNLLTGETGSGKSIIIEALGTILGGRGTKDLIRSGEEKAILQAVFYLENNQKLRKLLDEYGIEIFDDNLLIINREISLKYPSISRINDKTVTLSILNKISSKLVDIFAQHEHQSLFNVSNHKILVDSFGSQDFLALKEEIGCLYKDYRDKIDRLDSLDLDVSQRQRELDLLTFEKEEIEAANLSLKDEEELENKYNRLSNIKDIINGISQVYSLTSQESFDNHNLLDLMNKNISILNKIYKYDSDIERFLNRFSELNYELQDLSNDMDIYRENIDINEEELSFYYQRMDLVNKLKKKYGNTIEDILSYKDNLDKKLEFMKNYENEVKSLKNEIENLKKILYVKSEELMEERKLISSSLELKICEELKCLNMENVDFKVHIDNTGKIGPDGIDSLEFLISTNPGEELKPMSKIVSGGEMSRIMLALKSIIAKYDEIPTLIFDEIDTGISGRTAQVVGEKILDISKNTQIISISHLPQITALADSHYSIMKRFDGEKTVTDIVKLTFDERINELAKLLGGADVTDTTKNHAREMLEMSSRIKKLNV